jgi:hypothetical protein
MELKIDLIRSAKLDHHLRQAQTWLRESDHGERSTMLSYAAFELRLTVERLTVHYWREITKDVPMEGSPQDIRSFKKLKSDIYRLGGHQLQINKLYEFIGILMNTLEIDKELNTPDVGRLSSYWGTCSEMCHIHGNIACGVEEWRRETFTILTEIASSLEGYVSGFGWPKIVDSSFADLKNAFIQGTVGEEEVVAFLRDKGVWAKAVFDDGRKSQIIGRAVPPGDCD